MARTIAKDHDAKRVAILKTAARVFAEQGFARASMSQVALACGISKATIYHYYDGKDALLFDILDSYLRALRDRLAALPEGGAPDQRLQGILAETLLAYDGMDNEHKIQTEGIPLLPVPQQEILKGYQRDMVRQLSVALRDTAPDVFDGDAPRLRDVTMTVFGMLNWFYMWNREAGATKREAYAALVADLTLKGVRGL